MNNSEFSNIRWPCFLSNEFKTKLAAIAQRKTLCLQDLAILQDLASSGVSYIIKGTAVATLQTNTLKTINHLVLGQGDWLGDYQTEKNNLLLFNLLAVEPLTLYLFNNSSMAKLLKEDMEAYKWLYHIAKESQPKWLQSQLLSSENKLIKIVHLLLEITFHQAGGLQNFCKINVSQQQLAEMIGISRQRVNEVLVELQAEGYLTLERNVIHLLDLKALGNLLDDSDLSIRDPRTLLANK